MKINVEEFCIMAGLDIDYDQEQPCVIEDIKNNLCCNQCPLYFNGECDPLCDNCYTMLAETLTFWEQG